MRKVAARFLQIAFFVLLSVTISNSIQQLRMMRSHCVGYPCTSSADCGANCFCSIKVRMCLGGIID